MVLSASWLTPSWISCCRAEPARRSPRARLYSVDPRSSQLPSICTFQFGCDFMACAMLATVWTASGRRFALSKSKYTSCAAWANICSSVSCGAGVGVGVGGGGGCDTVTCAVASVLPAGPFAVRWYVVVSLGDTVSEPLVFTLLPSSATSSAFSVLQVRVADWPG